jgi:hypothetical protein
MGVDKREFAWEFSQLSCPWLNENKSSMRVDWILLRGYIAKTLINFHQNLNQFKVNDFINKVGLAYHYGTTFNNISVELAYRQRITFSIIDPNNYCKTSDSTRLYWERSLWWGISWRMARWRCRYKNIFHTRWMLLAQRNRNVSDSHVKTWTYLRLVHSTCSPFNLFIQFYPSLHYYKVSFGTLH